MANFHALLHHDPLLAIDRRLDQLEAKARTARIDVESAKVSTAALMVLGAGLSANPLCAVLAGIGAVGYAGAVILDFTSTGQFRPLPVLRKGAGDLLATIGGVGRVEEEDIEAAEIETLAGCLPPREGKEFFTLAHHGDRLVAYLQGVAPEQRLNAYRQAVKRPRVLAGVKAVPVVETVPTALPQEDRAAIGPTTRLQAVAVPVIAAGVAEPCWDADEPLEVTQGVDDLARLREALSYPAVLIFGASGAGKSTLARWFIYQRLALGHTVEILDPHVAYGQWAGLPVYGAGLDYETCNDRLGHFADLVQSRYQTLAKKPGFHPRPHTVLVEEFTNWASKCSRAADFFSSSMSDLRKVNCCALYVAHGRTLTALGGSRGTAQQRDASLLMIELDAKVGPQGKPVPAGRGRIYYPGRHDAPVDIVVPDLSGDETGHSSSVSPTEPHSPTLESAYSADSSDELVALIREILIKEGKPLLASEIRQKRRALKNQMETEPLDALLQRMALEGFLKTTGETPARYTV